MKKKCCHVRMLSPNKTCSKDNLDKVIDVQQYNYPLIHQQQESQIQAVIHYNYATTEGPRGKSTELLQAAVQHNVKLNGKLLGEEPRNMVQQLLGRRVQFSLCTGFCRPFSSPPALPLGLLGFSPLMFFQCDGCLFLSFGVGAHGWVALLCQSWGHYFNLGAGCQ